jgi:2,6-dihydroxypyridine 3-monooxygenase
VPAMPRVAVVGGSLGGLTAALVLRDAGCEVDVYERSAAALQARGAGIAVLDQTLRYFLERTPLRPEEICSSTRWIRFVAADGAPVHERRHPYRFSSWNTVYRALLGCLDPDRYHLGAEVTDFADVDGQVEVRLRDGRKDRVDLLVCADGISSRARRVLCPEVRPDYAGYVAWRGTVPEPDLPTAVVEALADAITYQVLPGSHLLAYPIPGPDGVLVPGRRLMNFVWYRNVGWGRELDALMTGVDGQRREVSLPPGAARPEAVAELRAEAERRLAPQLATVVLGVPEPFVQAVFDIEVPRMSRGRVCLVGDAAFAVRPHAAAGTAKAAADGWALAEELVAARGEVPAALTAWERRELHLGRDLLRRTRDIGNRSQFEGTFRPGDPSLIFGLHEPGR